ncbi:RidA family protein [Thalassococcus sp. S3]|uniref:RidA family protein n=1 Tax=Thalassococcus sp. S3 TaxID=2017482 RepID=UPI00102419FA|nr:RidA family protein [Thalassococcus sp. S3]QBF33820.1 hypothetical protein CFI11_21770 [Thalassococcus sp. S3]
MSKNITRMNPATLPNAEELGYSQISIVEPGRMAYVSGQVARRPDSSAIPESLEEQTKIAAGNALAALDALGATPDDIAIMRIFMTDLNDAAMAEAFPVILDMLAGTKPSITGVGVAALAEPDLKIEIELTVRLPD